MTRIILFDIDGVIIRPPHCFGKTLEVRGYANAESILNDFFINENTDCTEGRANISEKIVPYLELLGWKESVEEFFLQEFEFETKFLDREFIEYIKRLQSDGIICYLASAQEDIRAKYFLETVGFKDIFDGNYISCNIGYRKDKSEYWDYVLSDLQEMYQGLELNEIVFFDDGKKNIDMANTHGIQAFLFTDMEQFFKDIEALKYFLDSNI